MTTSGSFFLMHALNAVPPCQYSSSSESGQHFGLEDIRVLQPPHFIEWAQQFVIKWWPQGVDARIIDAHPRKFADPQDDSIFHPRTWHRAAGLRSHSRAAFKSSDTPSQSFARKRSCRRKPAEACHEDHAFVSWQIVDDDDISGPQRWRQR